MKKFLYQKINFAYAVIVMLILTLGVHAASAGYSLPGDTASISPLIHQGGGEQATLGLRLGECPPGSSSAAPCNPISEFDSRGPAGAITLFEQVSGAIFNVLNTANVEGTTYIAGDIEAAQGLWKGTAGGLQFPIQQVNVFGDARATNLSNTSAKGNVPVCFDRSGGLVLCPEVTTGVNGSCGSANGIAASSTPTSNLCNAGASSSVTENISNYTWTCNGQNGGSNASCSAPKQGVGSCGTADGQSYASAPSNGLCSGGTPSSVSQSGSTYTWTCSGSNGGSVDSCSANQVAQENGVCASFSGAYSAQPATNTANACAGGTYQDRTDDTSSIWRWRCNGINGGTDALDCQANVAVAGPSCTSYTGTYTSQPATSTATGCGNGSYSNISDTVDDWRWTCTANGTTQACDADKISYSWEIGTPGACTGASTTTRQRIQFDVSNADGGHNICTNFEPANPYQVPESRSTNYWAQPYVTSGGSTVTGAFGGSSYIDQILQDNGVPAGGGGQTPSFSLTFPDNNCTNGLYYCGGSGIDIYTRCEISGSTAGTQTIPVVCKQDQNGATVADNLCPQPKPPTSQSC